MNTKTRTLLQDANPYINMSQFVEEMYQRNVFPYETKFSFRPLLDVMAHKIGFPPEAVERDLAEVDRTFPERNTEVGREPFRMAVSKVLAVAMPSMLYRNNPVFMAPPFMKEFTFCSDAMEDLMFGGNWVMKLDPAKIAKVSGDNSVQAGALILKRCYGQDNIEILEDQILTLRNVKTHLEKHFRININLDYVQVNVNGPLPELSEKMIDDLLGNLEDSRKWLELLPLDKFSFEGVGIARLYEVTESEVLSILKDSLLLEEVENDIDTFLPMIEKQIADFLGRSDVSVGMIGLKYTEFLEKACYSLTGKNITPELHRAVSNGKSGAYMEAIRTGMPVVIPDLELKLNPSFDEQLLLEKGIKSLILIPLEADGAICTVFEIGARQPRTFSSVTLKRLKEVIDLLHLGNIRYLERVDNATSMFIQEQFTSIHPSVEWRFEQVANNFQVRSGLPDFDGTIEPIVFKDIFPLYGQSDIVGSSNLRNASIRADLIDNLKRLKHLLSIWLKDMHFHLLEAYEMRIEKLIQELETEFISTHESLVMDLLNREVHPLIHDLNERYEALSKDVYEDYFNYLDPSLNIVYQKRKDYEVSVSKLNQAISEYIEQDDQKMQKILPHYFEKYKTDGVEYNIYIGQSILAEGKFSEYYLRDFRLWQLVQMCEVARLVNRVSEELPVPLKTAQLVFVYNNQLSIRFRMDEKQFDVDGTYNVRYEILKKRVDKAVVQGTTERLTQAGKVSIVYLQEKERREYLEYLEFLIAKGYIEPEYEDLRLGKLQGAEGLRALRAKVII